MHHRDCKEEVRVLPGDDFLDTPCDALIASRDKLPVIERSRSLSFNKLYNLANERLALKRRKL